MSRVQRERERERERERRSSHVVVGAHFVHFQLNWSCGVVPIHFARMVYVVPIEEILSYARASVLHFHMVVNFVSIGNKIIYIYIYISFGR